MLRLIAERSRHFEGGNVPANALLTVVLLTWMFILAAPAMAEELEWENSGTGDWGGARTSLAKRGITFSFTNDTVPQYNVSGGIDTGGAVGNRFVVFMNFELGPLAGLDNSSIRVSAAWYAGDDINEKVGAILKGDTNYLDPHVRLYELYWSQDFADKQFNLHLGRVGLGPMEFGYTPILYEFLSAGFSSNPGGFFVNQPVTTFSEAVATWGARLLITPKGKRFEVRLGAYNGWPRDQGRTDAHGLDFSMNLDESTFLIGEFAYKLNQRLDDKGLPGNYKFGVMHDTGPFNRFDSTDPTSGSVIVPSSFGFSSETGSFVHYDSPVATKRGETGYYVVFDQLLHFEKPIGVKDKDHPSNWKVGWKRSHPPYQGLYLWGAFVAHPDESISLYPYWLNVGLHYKGLIPKRDADRVGVGFRYGVTTPDLALKDEYSVEFYYHYQILQWMKISPDVQYIWNPGGGDIPNSLVIGFEFSMDL